MAVKEGQALVGVSPLKVFKALFSDDTQNIPRKRSA